MFCFKAQCLTQYIVQLHKYPRWWVPVSSGDGCVVVVVCTISECVVAVGVWWYICGSGGFFALSCVKYQIEV